MTVRRHTVAFLLAGVLLVSIACGGGGSVGNSSSTITQPVTPPAFYVNVSYLPQGVQGDPYSATLTALNGSGQLTWSISGDPSQLPSGLTLSANGTIAGTPAKSGMFTITVQAVDSSSPPKTALNTVTLPIAQNLVIQTSWQTVTLSEYQAFTSPFFSASGGVPPYKYSVTQGSLPPGMSLNVTSGTLVGSAISTGTYNLVVAVQDSFSPPDQASQPVNITVSSAPLQLSYALGNVKPILNRPFSDTAVANGGTPPYSFTLSYGNLPPGLSIDASSGRVIGTPTTTGSYSFSIAVTDASGTPNTVSTMRTLKVAPAALGRNDSPVNATPIGNGSIQASISPPLDSTGTLAPDTDYYKLIASAGSTVHVETNAKRINSNDPLDTVIELTDVNGKQLSTGCNQPGGTTTFTSPCLNDDISANPHVQDSALDYKVPGTSGTQTFLIHVLDWSGNARPDMLYTLQASGAVDPLIAYSISLSAIVGKTYSQPLSYSGGSGTITFTPTSGSLPPGLTLSGTAISGTPTIAGNYSFTVQATDQSTPPQQSTASLSLIVANVLTITTAQVPNGMVGTPYSFQFTSSGGLSPITWNCYYPPPGLTFNANGTLTGIPTQSGTYTIQVTANDAGFYPAMGQTATQTFTVTIQ